MLVKAKQAGFYGNIYRFPGNVFELKDKADFSDKWMESVEQPAAKAGDAKKPPAEPKLEEKPAAEKPKLTLPQKDDDLKEN